MTDAGGASLTDAGVSATLDSGTLSMPDAGTPFDAGRDLKSNPTLAAIANNTALDLGRYACNSPTDNGGGCGAITDYSGFVYDRTGHQMLMFGGGHAGAYGNEVEIFDFNTLAWVPAYTATLCANQTPENFDPDTASWKDNHAPLARHTWDTMGVTMVNGRRSLVILTSGGLSAETCHGGAQTFPPLQTRTMWFDIEAKTWSYGRTKPDENWYYATAGEADPVSGKMLDFGEYGLKTYDPATDTVTQVMQDPASSYDAAHRGYSNNLVYFPPNDHFYYFMRGAVTYVWELSFDRAKNSVLIKELTTAGAPASQEDGWAYDSKNHVIGGGVLNNTFYAFDPATNTWDSKVMQVVSADGETPGNVVFHALDYDPVDNVYVFLSDPHRRTWAYRYK